MSLDIFRGLMLSILVIVCDIFWCIGFVSLISFQHYRWCCYQSFDVFRVFFFLSFLVLLSFYYQLCPFMLNLGENWSFDMSSEFSFLFFSFLVLLFFIVNCIRLFLILERVAYDTCDSRVTNIIYDFLNCFIF